MGIAAIGDDRLSGYNAFWWDTRSEVASWVTGSPTKSLARQLKANWTVNLAGKQSLISQALQVSSLEPDLVIIEYGQDQVCNGLGDPLPEIEMAIAILNKSYIILMPAYDLETISWMQRDKFLCAFRCPATSEIYAKMVNLELKELASDKVFYSEKLEDFLTLKEDYNKRDCINPSYLGGEAQAENVYHVFRNELRAVYGK